MTYDEHNDTLRVDPDSLTEKMKIEYFLDNFDAISQIRLENLVNKTFKAPNKEAIVDAMMYLQEANRAIISAEDEIESI